MTLPTPGTEPDAFAWDVPALLGREERLLPDETVRRAVGGRRILVTGGGGSIGRELVRQSLAGGADAVCVLDASERALFYVGQQLQGEGRATFQLCDVRDSAALGRALARFRPDTVWHAAAYKHVPMLENFPIQAYKTNILGTQNVMEAAVACGASRLILLSTDKAAEPSSVMGATKRVAEVLVRGAPGHIGAAVRFGNVLGSDGSVAHTFLRQALAGGPMCVTHPAMTRYFMTIPEAARLSLAAGALAHGGEVFVLDMGEPLSIPLLAQRFAARYGRGACPLQYTGVRPGEKLTECLLGRGERLCPTMLPWVGRVQSDRLPDLTHALQRMAALARKGDDEGLKGALFAAVAGEEE